MKGDFTLTYMSEIVWIKKHSEVDNKARSSKKRDEEVPSKSTRVAVTEFPALRGRLLSLLFFSTGLVAGCSDCCCCCLENWTTAWIWGISSSVSSLPPVVCSLWICVCAWTHYCEKQWVLSHAYGSYLAVAWLLALEAGVIAVRKPLLLLLVFRSRATKRLRSDAAFALLLRYCCCCRDCC